MASTTEQRDTALITGASSGIGAASARLFAEAGARVVVGYNRGVERANAVVASLAGNIWLLPVFCHCHTPIEARRFWPASFGSVGQSLLVNLMPLPLALSSPRNKGS